MTSDNARMLLPLGLTDDEFSGFLDGFRERELRARSAARDFGKAARQNG